MLNHDPNKIYGTTILSVRKGKDVVIVGDGQVSLGNTVMKSSARKIRKIGDGGIVGGLGAGCLWAGQGTYFTINAQRYASLMFLEINMVTAWFASIFATMYLY